MEPWTTTPAGTANSVGLRFVLLGLLALAASLLLGVIGAFKFLYPEFLEALPFHQIRPLHVSLAVAGSSSRPWVASTTTCQACAG